MNHQHTQPTAAWHLSELASSWVDWFELNLDLQGITELPKEIGRFQNLKVFSTYNNHLDSLPESLSKIPKLEKLDLRWNRFSRTPAWLEKLKSRGCIIHI